MLALTVQNRGHPEFGDPWSKTSEVTEITTILFYSQCNPDGCYYSFKSAFMYSTLIIKRIYRKICIPTRKNNLLRRYNISDLALFSAFVHCVSSSWTLSRTLACSTPAESPTGLNGSAHEAGPRPASYRPPLDSSSVAVKEKQTFNTRL